MAGLVQTFPKQPKLITFVSHTSAFTVEGENPLEVYAHSIVVKNAGRASATKVRVGHNWTPNIRVHPDMPYERNASPNGGVELMFENLGPGEQITISYLYYPPAVWNSVNSYVKSDEGPARAIHALPSPQAPRWMMHCTRALIWLGIFSALYWVGSAIKYALS